MDEYIHTYMHTEIKYNTLHSVLNDIFERDKFISAKLAKWMSLMFCSFKFFYITDFFLTSGRVKKVGDREVSIVTQCVKADNVQKNSPPTVGNLLLKINAKMGGTNNVLGTSSRPIVSYSLFKDKKRNK